MYVELIIISCNVFLTGIIASPNTFTNFATEYDLEFHPSTVNQPPARNFKEKMDVKELIETLQKKFRRSSTPIPITKTTDIPNVISKLYKSKYVGREDSSQNLVTELAILDTACNKVSDHLQLVHKAIEKNIDVMMKLNILKGMLLEESIRSKGSKPWIEYISKYNIFEQR